jgi:hypothetical protein
MNKILIKENDKIVAVLELGTNPKVFDYWINNLITFPERYIVEITNIFRFDKNDANNFLPVFGSLATGHVKEQSITEWNIKQFMFSVLQSFSLIDEYTKIMRKKENATEETGN